MPISPHLINYPKRQIHYRSGVYPMRRVTYHPVGSPQLTTRKCVSNTHLEQIINHDKLCPVEDVRMAAQQLHEAVTLFVDGSLFMSPGDVIQDVLNRKYKDVLVITHVS